jgi:hypothetical protein
LEQRKWRGEEEEGEGEEGRRKIYLLVVVWRNGHCGHDEKLSRSYIYTRLEN